MGILDAGQSSGGSVNQSTNSAASWAHTAGNAASNTSQNAAAAANASALSAWQLAAIYNSEEADKQRAWQEHMANTVYQRTIKDMKSAGINPILAANMGLGTASVGSGATASMSSPNTYMPQTFAEYNSASEASGESHGSSWNESTNGLMTALSQIATGISSALAGMSSGLTLNMNLGKELDEVKDAFDKSPKEGVKKLKEMALPENTGKGRLTGNKNNNYFYGGKKR